MQLNDRVALRVSFPKHALRAGDVATLVDFVEHPASRPRGCVLELFNALGESIGLAERELARVDMLRMLVQQEAQIGGRPVGRSDSQEHVVVVAEARYSSIGENRALPNGR